MKSACCTMSIRRLGPGYRYLFVAAVFLCTLLAVAVYYPLDLPIGGDGAYFMYMGQEILRGESVYRTTTLGYPPLVPLLNAAAMAGGRAVGLQDFMSSRLLAVLILFLTTICLFRVVDYLLERPWAGLAAVILLLGFRLLMLRGIASLEPKIVIQLLMIAAIDRLLAEKTVVAGVLMGLACTVYHPVALAAMAIGAAVFFRFRPQGKNALGRYAAGAIAGMIPAGFYLLVSGQTGVFLKIGAGFKLGGALTTRSENPGTLFQTLHQTFRSSPLPILEMAGASLLLWTGIRLYRLVRGDTGDRILYKQTEMAWLSAAWIVLMALVMASPAKTFNIGDVLPFHFLFAFWITWGLVVLGEGLCHLWQRVFHVSIKRWVTVAGNLSVLLVLVVAAFQVHKQYRFPGSVGIQQRLAGELVADLKPGRELLAIKADEIYVLLNRRSPWRYLRLSPYFDAHMKHFQPDACGKMLGLIDQGVVTVVVYRDRKNPIPKSGCFGRITKRLKGDFTRSQMGPYRIFRRDLAD